MTKAELKAAILKSLGDGTEVDSRVVDAVDGIMKTELKNWVPQERFDEVVGQKKVLSETLTATQGELKTLKDSPENISKLINPIEELQTKMTEQDAEYSAKILNSQKDAAIQEAILSCGRKAFDTTLVSGMFDKEKIVIKDGNVEGIKDQMDALMKDKSFLFEPSDSATSIFRSKTTFSGGGGGTGGDAGFGTDKGALNFAKELAASKRASLGLKTGADE